jgi:quinoprotein glucose dehydrogenase
LDELGVNRLKGSDYVIARTSRAIQVETSHATRVWKLLPNEPGEALVKHFNLMYPVLNYMCSRSTMLGSASTSDRLNRLSRFRASLALAALMLGVISGVSRAQSQGSQDWPVINGDAAGDHYSPLAQINRGNVSELRVAWTFDTGEKGGLETNPLVIARVVYACTPSHKVLALDAASGKLLWKFDSGIPGRGQMRGLAYWTDGHESRIFGGVDNFLYALDARDGKAVQGFGEAGRIDLRKGLGRDYRQLPIWLTSPGIVYKDLIIVGGAEPEEHPAPPGDIRAYDVRTGVLRWTFHTIPHPGELGYDTWPKDAWQGAGGANNWAGMSLDAKRGIVYVPTGSAVFDLYGHDRIGDDLFSDTLLALDANTGRRLWHFQGVHHDLWDRDFPSPPVLLSVTHAGKQVDAVAQTTKSGYVFLFDRRTGEPLFPIKNVSTPASTVPGEVASPTQPIPTIPLPFTRQGLNEDMLTTRTTEAHTWAVKQFRTFASGSGGQFVPPTVDKFVALLPGTNGGAEWGGPAVDPATGVLYVNANETPRMLGVTIPPPPGSEGEHVYQDRCSGCHGLNRAGTPPDVPSLVGIDARLSDQEIEDTVHQGKGRMPPFSNIDDDQLKALIHYLKLPPTRSNAGQMARTAAAPAKSGDEIPYKSMGSLWFVDPDGYPAVSPPWGTLSAIDMNTGTYLWKIPLGSYPELAAKRLADTGTLNYGGPVVTAGGVLFIAATVFDKKIHAFDSRTGKLLWEGELPFPALATPATYMVNGKQYVLIASGGGSYNRGPSGGVYVAFALP